MIAAAGARLRGAAMVGVAVRNMASGGGHDALILAALGVPAAMLFIRNEHGSQDPREAIEIDDFVATLDVLEAAIGAIAA